MGCESVPMAMVPRFEILTFRGHVLQSCELPLARAIVASPWLGGSGCALPCFGWHIDFRWFFE